jgi:hypothetical protein
VGQERLGPSYLFISLVLGPLNSLKKIPRGVGWRIHCGIEVTELSTNKQHTLSEEEGSSLNVEKAHARHAQLPTRIMIQS